jgi:hypothetical protein
MTLTATVPTTVNRPWVHGLRPTDIMKQILAKDSAQAELRKRSRREPLFRPNQLLRTML